MQKGDFQLPKMRITTTKPLTEQQKEQLKNYFEGDYTDVDKAKHFVMVVKGTLSPQIKWKIDLGYNFEFNTDESNCHYLEFFYREQ